MLVLERWPLEFGQELGLCRHAVFAAVSSGPHVLLINSVALET